MALEPGLRADVDSRPPEPESRWQQPRRESAVHTCLPRKQGQASAVDTGHKLVLLKRFLTLPNGSHSETNEGPGPPHPAGKASGDAPRGGHRSCCPIPQEILPHATRLSLRKTVSFQEKGNLVCAVTNTEAKNSSADGSNDGPSTKRQGQTSLGCAQRPAARGRGGRAVQPAARTPCNPPLLFTRCAFR